MITIDLLASYLISALIGFFLIPALAKLKMKQTERLDGPKSHLKKNGTPTMGGIMIISAFIIMIIALSIYYAITKQANPLIEFLPVVFASIGFGFIGFLDDFAKATGKKKKGISAKAKMAGLLIISLAFITYMVFVGNLDTSIVIPFIKTEFVINKWLYIIFAVLVMLGTTNAINLTDGVDGLASFVCVAMLLTLTIIAQKFHSGLNILTTLVIGSTVGFLTYNIHPAKVFMGDTGSLFLGGFIATTALVLRIPLILLIIGIMPIIETVSVMLQVSYFKLTKGKRLFKMAPFHHHLELSGWSETIIVIAFTLITIIASLVALYSLGIRMF